MGNLVGENCGRGFQIGDYICVTHFRKYVGVAFGLPGMWVLLFKLASTITMWVWLSGCHVCGCDCCHVCGCGFQVPLYVGVTFSSPCMWVWLLCRLSVAFSLPVCGCGSMWVWQHVGVILWFPSTWCGFQVAAWVWLSVCHRCGCGFQLSNGVAFTFTPMCVGTPVWMMLSVTPVGVAFSLLPPPVGVVFLHVCDFFCLSPSFQ